MLAYDLAHTAGPDTTSPEPSDDSTAAGAHPWRLDEMVTWLAGRLEWEDRLHELGQARERRANGEHGRDRHPIRLDGTELDLANNTVNGPAVPGPCVGSWPRAPYRTHEYRTDGADTTVLAPERPEPDNLSARRGSNPTATRQTHSTHSRPALARLRRKAPRLRVVAFVIAATIAGSAGTHWFDHRAPTNAPPLTVPCRQAINATAQLHRLQDAQFAQGMQSVWALVAGIHVENSNSIGTSIARLQRDADNATARCISQATPTPGQ
jgi:hypothetical protein